MATETDKFVWVVDIAAIERAPGHRGNGEVYSWTVRASVEACEQIGWPMIKAMADVTQQRFAAEGIAATAIDWDIWRHKMWLTDGD